MWLRFAHIEEWLGRDTIPYVYTQSASYFLEDYLTRSLACCVGHEIVGKAVKVGSNVKHVKVGDRGTLTLNVFLPFSDD